MLSKKISIEERAAIERLRSELKSDLQLVPSFNEDFQLLRWLQGHDFDFDEVVPKLRAHLELRRLWQIDSFLERPDEITNPVVRDYWPFGISLLGPAMDPDDPNCNDMIVFLEKSAKIDGFGVLKSCSNTKFLKTRIHGVEMIMQKLLYYERLTGRQWGVLFIFDCEGMHFDKETVDLVTGPFKFFADFMTQQYVEIFKKFLVINTPPVIAHAWAIIKPILPKKTTMKVEILGSTWRTDVLKYINADRFPEAYGGSLRDKNGDPCCSQWISIPKHDKVPESLYWVNLVGSFDVKFETKWIPPGKQHLVEITVEKAKSKLVWKYFASFEYSFGMYRKALPGQPDLLNGTEQILPNTPLFDRTYSPEDEQLLVNEPGIYVFRFGNDHAWFRSLKLDYFIDVILP